MNCNEILFSVIVPVYNRPQEMEELLQSLAAQTDRGFEVMVMEGIGGESCQPVCSKYSDRIAITFMANESGRSQRRNLGMQRAHGNYFVLFDSDCIIPPEYFARLRAALANEYVDCYGGPDAALDSFSTLQRAVNYSMTSLMTTGGIRGAMKRTDKYLPRAFNMGFSREVFERTGGYLDMIGEDVDLSMRIKEAGFKVRLVHEVFVYHKRRLTLKSFYRQVNTFGKARVLLSKRHPHSLKLVHLLPTVFALGHILLLLIALATLCPLWLMPIPLYATMIFVESLIKNKSVSIAALSIITSYTQLFGYGFGLINEFVTKKASSAAAEKLYRQ